MSEVQRRHIETIIVIMKVDEKYMVANIWLKNIIYAIPLFVWIYSQMCSCSVFGPLQTHKTFLSYIFSALIDK